ncbi:MAG TPA: M1 family aminopeptidase [Flavobacterium sp.]|jgi:aminopeptidase N
MKNIYLLMLLSFVSVSFAQDVVADVESIAEAEMKAASGLFNLQINPNTANYNITYQKLDLTVDPEVYFISGIVTTTYTALANMSTLTLELTNELTVSSVTKNNAPLTFVQNANEELVINLGTVQTAGTSGTVVITYSGEPSSGEDAFTTTTHSGAPILFTLSEPFGARDWWPCKQDLTDKIDNIDVWITAPSQYVSVSNGIQTSATINGANKTTKFHHGYPIASYLVAIAVTNYTVFTQQAGTAPNEFPIINYIYPESTNAQTQLAQTLPIMDLFESLFETYPFADEKYGHAQFQVGGGMEHQTVSFMGSFGRDLIAHELGHQWFGDKVTTATWNDIWLNEGFASYMDGLVRENFDGPTQFIAWKNALINNITSATNGSVYVPASQENNVGRIFDSRLTYNKGAMVVEMLRWKLGDANFFQGMRNYLADPDLAYDFATTPDLQAHLEAVSGLDLDGFFADWIYGQGYPMYAITAQNVANGQVQITVNQTQSHFSVPFYEMPIEVRVFGSGAQQMDLVLENTTDNQVFLRNVPFAVTSIQFDPKRHIISKNNTASLGSPEINLANAVTVYPNPASDQVTIGLPTSVEIKKVSVYNALGQIVLESTSDQINVSALSTGIHIMRIETSEGIANKKFVKK